MRGLRSTLVMLALFVAIGGYAYFIESERAPASDPDVNEPAFDIDADAIVSLRVAADNGDVTDLSRSADDLAVWTITSPVDSGADGVAASSIANSLASLEIRRVVEEAAADLALFGLADPVFQVEFDTGENLRTLAVGDQTPTGADRYAVIGDGTRVFLIANHLESTFNRTTFDLRDKSILDVTAADVSRLVIAQHAESIAFAKGVGDWRITDPWDVRADFGIVEGLVGRLGSEDMRSVEAEAADDSAQEPFGLDEPRLTVTVEAGDATLGAARRR